MVYYNQTPKIIATPAAYQTLRALLRETTPYPFNRLILRFLSEDGQTWHYAIDPNNKKQINTIISNQTKPTHYLVDMLGLIQKGGKNI